MPYKDITKQRAFQNNSNKTKRLTWLAENGPCVRCGSNQKLEVDHIDPLQKTSHRIWSWRAEKRLVELKKCQVLCLICHKKKTAQEAWQPICHGTKTGYARGCRCPLCSAEQSRICALYKLSKKLTNRRISSTG